MTAVATPYELPVELGKVREFATATKAAHPAFYDGDRPPIPPTFLTVAELWAPTEGRVLRGLGLDWSSLLHGGQRYVFTGEPPHAGDRLTATERIVDTRTTVGRRSGPLQVIDYVIDFATLDGAVVAREFHTTLVTTGVPRSAGPRRSAGRRTPTAEAPAEELDPDRIGTLVDEPVTKTDIVRYQGASGDLNPIHHDDDHARAAGYPGAFSVGMLHAGILGSHVASSFGPENVREFGVRFREQMWPGDVLTYGGRVARHVPAAEGTRVELELSVCRPDGELCLSGSAVVVTRTDDRTIE